MGLDFAQMSDEELERLNQAIGAERAEAEAGFKARQQEVAAEIERRSKAARLAKLTDGLSDEDKEALKQHLGL